MARLSSDCIKDFQERLKSSRCYAQRFNIRQAIAKSYHQITQARKQNVSWQVIAELLEASSHDEIKVSAKSVSNYYYAIRKEKQADKPLTPIQGQSSSQPNSSQNEAEVAPSRSSSRTSISRSASLGGGKKGKATPQSLPSKLAAVPDQPQPQSTETGWKEPAFNVNRVRPQRNSTETL